MEAGHKTKEFGECEGICDQKAVLVVKTGDRRKNVEYGSE